MRLSDSTGWIRWAFGGAVSLAIACGFWLMLGVVYSHVAKPLKVPFARGVQSLFAEQTGFFPEGALWDYSDEWYSKTLLAMGEQPLRATRGRFAYRLIFSPASADIVSIRVEASGEEILLHIKTLRRASLKPQTMNDHRTLSNVIDATLADAETTARVVSVSPLRWSLVESLIHSSRFWSLPPTCRDLRVEIGALYFRERGEPWLLEALLEGRYHVVQRSGSDPCPTSSLYRACLELLRLAGQPGFSASPAGRLTRHWS